jgi:hypothetical protein
VRSGGFENFSSLLPSPIQSVAHRSGGLIRRLLALFFASRISLRIGEFFDDSGDHESGNLTIMALGFGPQAVGMALN